MQTWLRKHKEELTGYLFVLPNMLGLIGLTLLPILFSVMLSFTEWNFLAGFSALKWVGLDNYKAMWQDQWFIKSLTNNLIYVAVTVPLIMLIALPTALILNRRVYLKKLIRLMIFMPYVSSVVAVSVVWGLLYRPSDGIINSFLKGVGISDPQDGFPVQPGRRQPLSLSAHGVLSGIRWCFTWQGCRAYHKICTRLQM